MTPLNPADANKENCPDNEYASQSHQSTLGVHTNSGGALAQKSDAIPQEGGNGNGNISAAASSIPPLAPNFSVRNEQQPSTDNIRVQSSSSERQRLNGNVAHTGIGSTASISRNSDPALLGGQERENPNTNVRSSITGDQARERISLEPRQGEASAPEARNETVNGSRQPVDEDGSNDGAGDGSRITPGVSTAMSRVVGPSLARAGGTWAERNPGKPVIPSHTRPRSQLTHAERVTATLRAQQSTEKRREMHEEIEAFHNFQETRVKEIAAKFSDSRPVKTGPGLVLVWTGLGLVWTGLDWSWTGLD
ncbi:hypothetical protein F5887DRAFT_921185 [Amanita rubescens]|nr:hypothetical protein F5887DRAFT_921185 [Amanita rubescens]